MSRAVLLLRSRTYVEVASASLCTALALVPQDPAFDAIRADLHRLHQQMEERHRELTTYWCAAATIESTQIPLENAEAAS